MNLEQLGQRDRRVLAVGLLMSVILVFALLVVKPMIGAYSGYRGEIAKEQFRLERYKKIVASLPHLEREVEVLRQRVDNSGLFLAKNTPDLAAAGLQQRLEKIVNAHDSAIRSVQVLAPVAEDAYTQVRVRATLRTDSPALAAILRNLETGRPVVIVDHVTINPEQSRRRNAQRFSGELKVRLELNAFMRRSPEE